MIWSYSPCGEGRAGPMLARTAAASAGMASAAEVPVLFRVALLLAQRNGGDDSDQHGEGNTGHRSAKGICLFFSEPNAYIPFECLMRPLGFGI